MSISLAIDWPDGSSEDVGIATQRGAERWADLARSIGLQLVPHFHSFLVVDAGNLDQIRSELRVFRQAILAAGSEVQIDIEAVDRLVAALDRLKTGVGWKASIG